MFVDTKEAVKVRADSPDLMMLRNVRDLLGDEKRHCRYSVGRDAKGTSVNALHTRAVAWCLMGAADKVSHEIYARETVVTHCQVTIDRHPELFRMYNNPITVNNFAPHSVTMRMLDLTIERLERAA